MNAAYQSTDELFLWFLTQPKRPVLIGSLHFVKALRGVSLRYAPSWLEGGFALSEDLPLIPGEFMPAQKETAAGAVDDARPDRWGERVIRFIDKPPRLSLMEYLYFAGDDRFGALGVSTSNVSYRARTLGLLPTLKDVDKVQSLVESWRMLCRSPRSFRSPRMKQWLKFALSAEPSKAGESTLSGRASAEAIWKRFPNRLIAHFSSHSEMTRFEIPRMA